LHKGYGKNEKYIGDANEFHDKLNH